MIRVKICGITNEEDALVAAQAGADAVGFVLAESPRRISAEAAQRIAGVLPPFVTPVLVLVNETPEAVAQLVQMTGVRTVQLCGEESPGDIQRLPTGLKVLKAVRLRSRRDVEAMDEYRVDGFVIDAAAPGRYGGTGELADWGLAREVAGRRRVMLAGGLGPQNVAQAVREVSPFGVDVSSGVESAPGKKDGALVRAFVSHAREAFP